MRSFLWKLELGFQSYGLLSVLGQSYPKLVFRPPTPRSYLEPLIKVGVGGSKFLLERGHKPEKGGWCRNGGLPFFYHFTVQSHLHCLWEKYSFLYYFFFLQSSELAMQDSHPNLYSTKTMYHTIVLKHCWLLYLNQFRIQRKLHINFFKYQGKIFLNIEKVLVKISEEQP